MKKISLLLAFTMILFCFTGCQSQENTSLKRERQKPKAASVAFSSAIEETEEGVNVVYLGVGVDKDGKITYLSINLNEFKGDDTNVMSVKEQGESYGLCYEGYKGDWRDQMEAFEDYAIGKSMTIDQLLETELDENGVPVEDSDLFAACEIDLRLAMEALESAKGKMQKMDVYSPVISQYVYRTEDGFELSIMLNIKDQYEKIKYVEIEQYDIIGHEAIRKNEEEIEKLEDGILGLTNYEVCHLETYDAGDGIHNSLPMENSFLGDISINIGFLKEMYRKI